MQGKIVVITGCTSGIGKEVARECARLGARVMMVCRNLAKAEEIAKKIIQETQNPQIETFQCDLSSLSSVRTFTTNFLAQHEKIDALILNAGVFSFKKTLTQEGFELQYGVNYLAHFLMTMQLLPALLESGTARVISVASLLHLAGRIDFANFRAESGYGPSSAYAQSKLANILFMKELSRFLQATSVKAYSLHPGTVSTSLLGEQPNWLGKISSFLLKTPKKAASDIVSLITQETIKEASGTYFSEGKRGKLSPLAEDISLARRLWNVSLQQCGLNEEQIKKSQRTPDQKKKESPVNIVATL